MVDIPVPAGPEKITHEGRMFEMVEQPMQIGDKQVIFETARRAPGVRLIVPTKEGKMLLTKEYRAYMDGYDVRLPGGKVFDSLDEYTAFRKSGEDIKQAAKEAAIKEAREEVGIEVRGIDFFSVSVCGASVEWDLYYFLVTDFTEGTQALEHGEDITPMTVTRSEAQKMCLDGSVREERSALTLLRYLATQVA